MAWKYDENWKDPLVEPSEIPGPVSKGIRVLVMVYEPSRLHEELLLNSSKDRSGIHTHSIKFVKRPMPVQLKASDLSLKSDR